MKRIYNNVVFNLFVYVYSAENRYSACAFFRETRTFRRTCCVSHVNAFRINVCVPIVRRVFPRVLTRILRARFMSLRPHCFDRTRCVTVATVGARMFDDSFFFFFSAPDNAFPAKNTFG